MPITTFAFAGTSGANANDFRNLIMTGGFRRYSELVQSGLAVVKFRNFYMNELKPFEDNDGEISIPRMALIMEGEVMSIRGEFPNNITEVEFVEGDRPKVTFAYKVSHGEGAFMHNELGGHFGIKSHLIEEPYELPIQYTTDYFEARNSEGFPITILSVNVVQPHNLDMNTFDYKAIGESLIMTECYPIEVTAELEDERGEFYQAEQERMRLEQADKEEQAKKPIVPETEVAKLTPEEVALNVQSERVGEYVEGVLSEQDARRKKHELDDEERRKSEIAAEQANAAAEAAAAEAARKEREAAEAARKAAAEKADTASAPGKFDQARLNALLGLDDTPGDAQSSDKGFGE